MPNRLINTPGAHLFFNSLNPPSQPTLLHLRQGPTPTEENYRGNAQRHRQDPEQVPCGIIHEEQALHSDNRAIVKDVRNRRVAECFCQVVRVGAQQNPLPLTLVRARHKTLAQKTLTEPSSAGRATRTAAVKNSVITSGGLLGSFLKMWWISGCLP